MEASPLKGLGLKSPIDGKEPGRALGVSREERRTLDDESAARWKWV